MKTSILSFLLVLASASFVQATPMDNLAVSTGHDRNKSEGDSVAAGGQTTILDSIWHNEILPRTSLGDTFNALQVNRAFRGATTPAFKNHSAVMEACGIQTAKILIRQQWYHDYQDVVEFQLSNKSYIEKVRGCLQTAKNWVHTLGRQRAIKLKVKSHNHAETGLLLSDRDLFDSSRKPRFSIHLIVGEYNVNAEDLFSLFAINKELETLDFKGGSIHNEYVESLADELKSPTTTLKMLIMNHNSLNSENAAVLAEGLKENMVLQKLDLSGNEIGLQGCYRINADLRLLNRNGFIRRNNFISSLIMNTFFGNKPSSSSNISSIQTLTPTSTDITPEIHNHDCLLVRNLIDLQRTTHLLNH